MLEQEIHEAIRRGDLQVVWHLMVQRTVQLQAGTFESHEIDRLRQSTEVILRELVNTEEKIRSSIQTSMERWHVSRTYVWGKAFNDTLPVLNRQE